MRTNISKAGKFVLRQRCIIDEEFGSEPFGSLDVAEAMVAVGHGLDYQAILEQLQSANYIEIVERPEDTGGFNYYHVTDLGRVIGYPERYGGFDLRRVAIVSGPVSFSLTTLGIIGSPFAIANLIANDWNWNSTVRYLIDTYEVVFRAPVGEAILKIGGVLGIENVPTWLINYCVLGIIFWQSMKYASKLEMEYNYWSDEYLQKRSIIERAAKKTFEFLFCVLSWPLLLIWDFVTSIVLVKYYFDLDGFDSDTKILYPRMALTARFLGIILPLILFLMLCVTSLD